MRRLKPLTDRDLKTLRHLQATCDSFIRQNWKPYVRPMDIGAVNGSHHSATLNKLARRGLVEAKARGGWVRGSKQYTITSAGRELLAGGTAA